MKQQYKIKGISCSSCVDKISKTFGSISGVDNIIIENDLVTIDSQNPILFNTLENKLSQLDPKYSLTNIENETKISPRSWLEIYKPIVLIFAFIIGLIFLHQYTNGFHFMEAMRYFMAGFFLVFSFFKFLNLKDFALSYAQYDIVAKKFLQWGYVYAFIELALGVAYFINYKPILTNALTFVVMSISIVGVLQSVLQKKTIQCACLGAVFNLPMSTVTIIEDALMIVMSLVMLGILL